MLRTRFLCARLTTHRRLATSAYGGTPGDGTLGLAQLDYIPLQATLRDGTPVEVGPFRQDEWPIGMDLMNLIIREGRTWPFDHEFATLDAYRGYFLSHTALVVRSESQFLGCCYIKPNFPGRCSHVCNGGFLTQPHCRGRGVATLMGHVFLRVAKDLGYRSAYFNLVFASNPVSIRLWENLGFERVAVLEKAADLKGVPGLDTAYGYRFDLDALKDGSLDDMVIVK